MRDKKNRAIYQLHVQLCDINPPIWRRIQIVDDTKLPRLHRILQLLFNWEDYHLHEFQRVAVFSVSRIPRIDSGTVC